MLPTFFLSSFLHLWLRSLRGFSRGMIQRAFAPRIAVWVHSSWKVRRRSVLAWMCLLCFRAEWKCIFAPAKCFVLMLVKPNRVSCPWAKWEPKAQNFVQRKTTRKRNRKALCILIFFLFSLCRTRPWKLKSWEIKPGGDFSKVIKTCDHRALWNFIEKGRRSCNSLSLWPL